MNLYRLDPPPEFDEDGFAIMWSPPVRLECCAPPIEAMPACCSMVGGYMRQAGTQPPKCNARPHLLCIRDVTKRSGQLRGQRGSASERGYGAPWRKLAERIKQRDIGLCQLCFDLGRTTQLDAVDHIINRATADADGMVMTASGETMHYDDERILQSICNAIKTSREGNGGKVKPQFGVNGWPL
ncbi:MULTISPECIES: HNH endonuclease [unclassified Sulfitobacter]|jgi:5-methylcytosine-specific restriction enzyme A|uniref:HNH endonuclease n=1 Tax=unclassified Sulfitobacter TaxID=196795 RepID=UPI0011B1CF02|nr:MULTISPECIES: HNH endonuclease [unclassified Sulfitobacter]ULO18983.1 HNH endonuclease [Sulfitobacter sp. CB2047]